MKTWTETDVVEVFNDLDVGLVVEYLDPNTPRTWIQGAVLNGIDIDSIVDSIGE